MAVVRYIWMFRIAAVVCLLIGLGWVWTALFTDFRVQYRPYILALGVAALTIAVFLFRRARWAIALSAIAAMVVSVSAVLFVPKASGPGTLFLLALAVVGGCYTALSFRALFTPRA